MSLNIASNFDLQSQQPNFARDMFDTVADMKAYPETSLPPIFITTVKGDGVYVYRDDNTDDATTGKWRKFESASDLATDFNAIKTQVSNWKAGMPDTDLKKSINTLVAEAVAGVIAGSPSALDTLKEIADWIGDDTLGAVRDLKGLRDDLDELIQYVGRLPEHQKEDSSGNKLYDDGNGGETTDTTRELIKNGYSVTRISDGTKIDFYDTEATAIAEAKRFTSLDGNDPVDYATYYSVAADTRKVTVNNKPVMIADTTAKTIVEYIDLKAGSGAGVEYTDDKGATEKVGGWEKGEKADKMSFQDFAYKLLHPYVAPSVALTINPSALQDKTGAGVSSVTMTAIVGKNSNDIVSVSFYVDGTLTETITSGVTDGGTFNSVYTPTSAIDSNTTFKVVVDDGKTTNDSEKSLKFAYPSYVGFVPANVVIDSSNVQNYINDGTLVPTTLQSGSDYTYTYTATDSRVVYLYDTSKTLISSIKDNNNFEYKSSFTNSNVQIGGVNYNCLQQNVAATVNNFKFIFA